MVPGPVFYFGGPGSRVPLEYFGVSGPRSHLDILESRSPPVGVPGPGSHVSGMTTNTYLLCIEKVVISSSKLG